LEGTRRAPSFVGKGALAKSGDPAGGFRLEDLMRVLFAFVVGMVLFALPAVALEKPAPGAVLLTVDGEIAVSNTERGAEFDRAMLRDIAWREVATHSPFLEGEQTFAGVPAVAFLARLGVEDGTLHAEALDGYSVSIPVSEIHAHDALLAMEHGGRPMRVRNRGPIWLIFPMTAEQAAAGDGEGRMIWQLRQITVTR
jgi:hypothetical protein